MKRVILGGGVVLAVCSTIVAAQGAPERPLPPLTERQPAPAPTSSSGQGGESGAASNAGGQTGQGGASSNAASGSQGASASPSQATRPAPIRLPSIDQLEKLDTDRLDQLLGLKPKNDIPPAARRSLERIGVIDSNEGGLPSGGLSGQPAGLVKAAIDGIKGPMVSRWGHILMRRALASRLAVPEGLDPVDFAASRARALNIMGEHAAARALAQDIDTQNWNDGLTDAALDAYMGSLDILGTCPIVQLKGGVREDAEWKMLQSICYSFAGQNARSRANLNTAFRKKIAPEVDILLAQRFAGAAAQGSRAVNLEWKGVDELTPWRFALASELGAPMPETLWQGADPYYYKITAMAPMLPVERRFVGAKMAAQQGIISSTAYVDLVSKAYIREGVGSQEAAVLARSLRRAYVARETTQKIVAMREIWQEEAQNYGGYVLTASAASRIVPSEDLVDESHDLVISMLSAGLDRNALAWARVTPQGSKTWAQLVLVQPNRENPVETSQINAFMDADESDGQLKSRFLLAGLAGLGRIDRSTLQNYAQDLSLDLGRETKWSRNISKAAEYDNPALVCLLAGLGMQGSGWDKMTPRHLYHIVSALNMVGLDAEARMIAAEAVARG